MQQKNLGEGLSNENSIELMEKKENIGHCHKTTGEERRKIVPKEVKNLKFILSNYSSVTKYSWEADGEKFISPNKLSFSREEKKIIKYLLIQRMPAKFRPEFYLIASGAKRELLDYPGYYEDLTDNFPEVIPSPFEHQIEMDLPRTFPEDPFFNRPENIERLRRVLLAYSRRNVSIGYCQGFNFIVGRLLQVFEKEEEAFWVFVQLVENILPIDYYSELAGIMTDCTILIKLVMIYLPQMYNHLIELGYELSLNNIIYKWFVSIFMQNLSEDLSFIIWDMLFLEGNIVMFKAAIGVLKILTNDLVAATDMEEVNMVLDERTKNLNDNYTLIYYLILRRFDFDSSSIQKNRRFFEPTIIETIMKNNEYKIKKVEENNHILQSSGYQSSPELRRSSVYNKEIVQCYREWPLCIFDNFFKYHTLSHLVLRTQDSPVILDDHFAPGKSRWQMDDQRYGDSKEQKDSLSFKLKRYKNLLIERRKHYCEGKSLKEEHIQTIDESVLSRHESGEMSEFLGMSCVMIPRQIDSDHSDTTFEFIEDTNRRSQSVIKPSIFEFPNKNQHRIDYSQLLTSINKNGLSPEEKDLFGSHKMKPALETEAEILNEFK